MPDETRFTAKNESQEPAPSRAAPPPEKRSGMRWVILVVVVVLAVAGVFLWRYLNTYESTDDAEVDGHLNPISARVSGYITKVNVDDNQVVEKGAVLVEIDPRDYQIAVENAKAELADAEATAQASDLNVPVTTVGTTSQVSSAEADVETATAGVSTAEHQVEAAKSRVQEAEADNTRAQADLVRYRDLVAKDEVSRQMFDQADASAKSDDASVAAAQQALAAAEQQVKEAQGRQAETESELTKSHTGPQQVAEVRARARAAAALVEQKKAALDQAQLNLQYCTVVAPASGVVKKDVEVGMNVVIGQPLLSIAELDDVWVTANFKESQLRRVRVGQKVTISVDAYSRNYSGHVDSISGASGARYSLLPPENATGNYVKVVQRLPVKIVLDPGQNSDHSLRLGMSVVPTVWVP
jgi:membrane fusion protein (multidrug efflux system)